MKVDMINAIRSLLDEYEDDSNCDEIQLSNWIKEIINDEIYLNKNVLKIDQSIKQ